MSSKVRSYDSEIRVKYDSTISTVSPDSVNLTNFCVSIIAVCHFHVGMIVGRMAITNRRMRGLLRRLGVQVNLHTKFIDVGGVLRLSQSVNKGIHGMITSLCWCVIYVSHSVYRRSLV